MPTNVEIKVLEEFDRYAAALEDVVREANDNGVWEKLERIEHASETLDNAWSGSCMGYHARVYYRGLIAPPAGAWFSQEWGLMEQMFADMGTRGDWLEHSQDYVTSYIFDTIEIDPDDQKIALFTKKARSLFDQYQFEILSSFESSISTTNDSILRNLKSTIEDLAPQTADTILKHMMPKGQVMTRDSTAMGQGFQAPPHRTVLAQALSSKISINICEQLAKNIRRAKNHIQRKNIQKMGPDVTAKENKIFIGHGRSTVWRELKDFLTDRLNLEWDEFNRIPVAGYSNTEHLAGMLDRASFAFLILTAEDETKDGKLHARANVIHEVGLFQGRLGFTKAIVLLEDGCEEFSNINGLGQIRFPTGDVSAKFEDIRKVLEREGILN